jgi:hypothetical protein
MPVVSKHMKYVHIASVSKILIPQQQCGARFFCASATMPTVGQQLNCPLILSLVATRTRRVRILLFYTPGTCLAFTQSLSVNTTDVVFSMDNLQVLVLNCTFQSNWAERIGGGLCLGGASTALVR